MHSDDNSLRKRARSRVQTSTGGADTNAKAALGHLEAIKQPTAEDRFNHGRIVQYNVLEGNIPVTRRENTAFAVLLHDFTDALDGLRNIQAGRIEQPIFMLDQIVDLGFTIDAADEVGMITDDAIIQAIFGFNTALAQAPAIRSEILEDKRDRAIEATNTRHEAVNKYFEDAVKYTSDAQNVHDSKVGGDLRETLARLRLTASTKLSPATCIRECSEYIAKSKIDDQKRAAAAKVLETIRAGNMLSTLNETEDMIFALAWTRCSHKRNSAVKNSMRDAIVDALVDSVDNKGSLVCLNGRCGRVLAALATLDYDPDVGSVMTFEAYKNQIFQETKVIVDQEIDRAAGSNDKYLRAVGEAYETGNSAVDAAQTDKDKIQDAEDQFKRDIKREIDRNIANYSEKMNSQELANIATECYVFADI